MTCPKCGSEQTGCIDSRAGTRKRDRRYFCQNCGSRFTTYELYAEELKLGAEVMQRMLDGCRGMKKK